MHNCVICIENVNLSIADQNRLSDVIQLMPEMIELCSVPASQKIWIMFTTDIETAKRMGRRFYPPHWIVVLLSEVEVKGIPKDIIVTPIGKIGGHLNLAFEAFGLLTT